MDPWLAPQNLGGVLVFQNMLFHDGGPVTTVTAVFNADIPPIPYEKTCPRQTLGACRWRSCPYPAYGYDPSVGLTSAGTIAVGVPASSVTLVPGAQGPDDYGYTDLTAPGDGGAFAPGTSFTISATGATVPAFAGTVVMPEDIRFTAPVLLAAASPSDFPTFAIVRSLDLSFAWNGGSLGDVLILLRQSAAQGSTEISCTFAASAHGGVIPAALLSALTPTDTPGAPLVDVSMGGPRFSTWLRLADWRVVLDAVGLGELHAKATAQ
jgi:hypothetical protein